MPVQSKPEMIFPRDPFTQGEAPRLGTLFIAPEGDILVPGTPAFYERIGYRNPDFDLGDYAVRNMGFVAVSRVAPTRLRVRFRPALLTGRAVEAICRYLAKGQASEVEINYLDGDWTTECWPNDPAVMQRVAELCTQPVAQATGAPFDIKPLELANAAKDYSNPLKPLFQKWRASFGTFDDSTMSFLARFGFLPRLVIITAPNAAETPRFQFLGSSLRIYDEQTQMEMIGRPVDEQPDKKFAEWISAQYKAVLDAHQPRLDSLQVAVQQTGLDQRHIGYDRLMLPWRSSTGTTLLTVSSVQTSNGGQQAANENPTGGRDPSEDVDVARMAGNPPPEPPRPCA